MSDPYEAACAHLRDHLRPEADRHDDVDGERDVDELRMQVERLRGVGSDGDEAEEGAEAKQTPHPEQTDPGDVAGARRHGVVGAVVSQHRLHTPAPAPTHALLPDQHGVGGSAQTEGRHRLTTCSGKTHHNGQTDQCDML